MKRGPSKGYAEGIRICGELTDANFRYIKELADRLGQLEGAMQASEMPVPTYLHDSPLRHMKSTVNEYDQNYLRSNFGQVKNMVSEFLPSIAICCVDDR